MPVSTLRRQDGIAHLAPIVLLAVASVAVIVAVAIQQYDSQKRASQEQQQAAKDAKLTADAKAKQATPTPSDAPGPTPLPSATPVSRPQATPTPTPRRANINHPTQANCNGKSFTIYASVDGGTPEYYESDTSSKIYRRVAYGQPITVVCDPSWSKPGWMLSGNSQVRFEDASLTKP